MSMFENVQDPLARLEALEININSLMHDKMQMVSAINHQANAITLLNQQVAQLIELNKIQGNQISILRQQVNPGGFAQQLGFK